MANFNTHLAGALLGCGILATACYNTQTVNAGQMGILWITGSMAGLLPDMDSGNSTSLRVIFNTISLLMAMIIVVTTAGHYPLLWTAAMIMAVYLLLRWVFLPVFSLFTVHRGNWHSLLTGFCISLLVTNITWHVNHVCAKYAWLLGLFTATGFLIHLILDELYSFNPDTLRFKRSFGTAIKPFSLKTPVITSILATVTIVQLWYLPPWNVMVKIAGRLSDIKLV